MSSMFVCSSEDDAEGEEEEEEDKENSAPTSSVGAVGAVGAVGGVAARQEQQQSARADRPASARARQAPATSCAALARSSAKDGGVPVSRLQMRTATRSCSRTMFSTTTTRTKKTTAP